MSKKFALTHPKYWFCRHYWVNEELRVPVSRHYYPSTFGVRQRHDAGLAEGGEYVCTGTPGTGFFVRSTDSHSYHKFVRALKSKYASNISNLLAGREPSYKREIRRVKRARAKEADKERAGLLERYQNCLELGQQAELLMRLHDGVKAKTRRRQRSMATSLITNLKSQLATLQHDMLAAESQPLAGASEEQQRAWKALHDAFANLMESRRLFSIEKDRKSLTPRYEQVFADKGVYNFIWMPGDTPLLRDGHGNTYYFYPNGIIRAGSDLDFSIHHYDAVSVDYQPVDLNALSEGNGAIFTEKELRRRHRSTKGGAASNLYGISRKGHMAQVSIPELGLNILCSKPEYAEAFTTALQEVMRQSDNKRFDE